MKRLLVSGMVFGLGCQSANGVSLETSAPTTVYIEGASGDGRWSKGPVVAAVGEPISVRVAPQEGLEVRWYQVFPTLDSWYQNANRAWEADPYQWSGFDEIGYTTVELTGWRGQWEVAAFNASGRSQLSHDPKRSDYHHTDMGSFWLEAQLVNSDGAVVARTLGAGDKDNQGLLPAVFRLTVRPDDSFVGILMGYFNVPGLFGSVTRQSRHYIGVDCADVQVSAYRELHSRYIERNVNVAHLVEEWKTVAKVQISGGVPDRVLQWGADVRKSDLIAVRYAGSRQFGHVGALYRDDDGNGVLSRKDLVLHAGPHPLRFSSLSRGGFDGEVVVLRAPR